MKYIGIILSMLLLLPNIAAAGSDRIIVTNIIGDVKVHDNSIKTGPDSSCDIQIENHICRIKENSYIELVDFDKEKSIRFKLLDGEILNKLDELPSGSSFLLETPEAVSGVRGTRFSVSRKEKRGTDIYVAKKLVHIESKDTEDKSVICEENEKVRVSPWPWMLYEAFGEGGAKIDAKTAVEISEDDYISRLGARKRIDTFRAAQLDGYRNLAKKIYGTVIKRGLTLEDYSKDNEIVTIKVEGIVRGAETIETKFYSDGIIKIRMIIKGDTVIDGLRPAIGDVFGANYLSSPELIEVKDFEQYIELESL